MVLKILKRLLYSIYDFMWNNGLEKETVTLKEMCNPNISEEELEKLKGKKRPLTLGELLTYFSFLFISVIPSFIVYPCLCIAQDAYEMYGLSGIDVFGVIMFVTIFTIVFMTIGINFWVPFIGKIYDEKYLLTLKDKEKEESKDDGIDNN